MIEQRSGKDFDNVVGPIVVCLGLVVALCLNFVFKVGEVLLSYATLLRKFSTNRQHDMRVQKYCTIIPMGTCVRPIAPFDSYSKTR